MSDPLVIVSGDSHVAPSMEQLREWCPKQHLEAFDVFNGEYLAALAAAFSGLMDVNPENHSRILMKNAKSVGYQDVDVRLKEMDHDGIAAEVLFHGTAGGGPIPFVPMGSDFFPHDPATVDRDLMKVGLRIYNQWLADFVSAAPGRLIGAAHLPIWDLDATIEEMEWARAAGLTVANFPSPRPEIAEYDDPVWGPLWDAAVALEMPLLTHTGFGDRSVYGGRHAAALLFLEIGGWPPRRGIARMIFGGVFEQHPELKLVITESPGAWWSYYESEFDSSWTLCRKELSEQVPKRPSEYMRTNVFHANSFMAHFEAEEAVAKGYSSQVIWGRDYPHAEGAWVFQEDDDPEPNLTHQALRFTFAGLPADEIRRMLGENGVKVYNLDGAQLAAVAAEINAPTVEDLSVPLDKIPEDGGAMAFRTIGPWA